MTHDSYIFKIVIYVKLSYNFDSLKLLINMFTTHNNYIFKSVLIYLIIKNIYTKIIRKTNFVKSSYKYYLIVISLKKILDKI